MSAPPDPLSRRLGLSPAALKGAGWLTAILAAVMAIEHARTPRQEWHEGGILPGRRRLARERVDPRKAPRASLVRLPGVGPATAEAIIERRETLGPAAVATEEGLLQVPNIGPLRLKAMRPLLELADPCGVD